MKKINLKKTIVIMKELLMKTKIDIKIKKKTSRKRYLKKINSIDTKQATQAISLCLWKGRMFVDDWTA